MLVAQPRGKKTRKFAIVQLSIGKMSESALHLVRVMYSGEFTSIPFTCLVGSQVACPDEIKRAQFSRTS